MEGDQYCRLSDPSPPRGENKIGETSLLPPYLVPDIEKERGKKRGKRKSDFPFLISRQTGEKRKISSLTPLYPFLKGLHGEKTRVVQQEKRRPAADLLHFTFRST